MKPTASRHLWAVTALICTACGPTTDAAVATPAPNGQQAWLGTLPPPTLPTQDQAPPVQQGSTPPEGKQQQQQQQGGTQLPPIGQTQAAGLPLGDNDLILLHEVSAIASAATQMAVLAQTHSYSPIVRSLGWYMAAYGQRTEVDVHNLGRTRGADIVGRVGWFDRMHLGRLSRRAGEAFDEKYLAYTSELLQSALDDARAAASLATDPDVHAFGVNYLADVKILQMLLRYTVYYAGSAYDVEGALQSVYDREVGPRGKQADTKQGDPKQADPKQADPAQTNPKQADPKQASEATQAGFEPPQPAQQSGLAA